MVVLTLVFLVCAPCLIRVFDSNPEVVRMGSSYLRTVSPFYVFTACAIVLGRALNGAGRTIATMVFTVLILWGVQIPLAVLLSRYLGMGLEGVWWGIAAANTVHGLVTVWWFQRLGNRLGLSVGLPGRNE